MTLDGVLFANSLHFVQDADLVLIRTARLIRPGGMIVVVEYDRDQQFAGSRTHSRLTDYECWRSELDSSPGNV